jgi:hypothetical protein
MVSQAASFKEQPMQLFSWLHKRMTGRPHTRRTSARKPARRFRPQIDALEDRYLLSFSAPVAYSNYTNPGVTPALVAADLNGDGKPDLISTSDNGEAINVWLNNGTGGFVLGGQISAGNGNVLAVGDVLGNGIPDIVAAGYGGPDNWSEKDPLSLLLGNGKGSFTRAWSYNVLPTPAPITSLALADFYGNGRLGLVAADTVGDVFVSTSSISTRVPPRYFQSLSIPAIAANPGPSWVAVGDVNGDGKPDIVVANSGVQRSGDSVSVLLGNGSGTFGAAQCYTVGGSPTAVAVCDFNRDGKLDIVTANSNSTVSVLLNNGNGTFGAAQNYAISGPANSVAVADFNHDGFLDIATTGAEMDVLLNNANGTFGAYQNVGPAGSNVVAADFNGDGFPDLAEIDASHSNIDVFRNNADWMVGPVSVSFGSLIYNSMTNLYSETVTLTNNSSNTLTGPLSLELTNLPSGVALTDATGTTSGNPYIRFLKSGSTLKPGASRTITLTFTAASLSDITFGTELEAV